MKYIALASIVFLTGCTSVSAVSPIDLTTTSSLKQANSAVTASSFIGEASNGMDFRAEQVYLEAQEKALVSGTKTVFTNPVLGIEGSVTVGYSELSDDHPGMECKKYSSVVWVIGKGKLVEGDACRTANSPWKAMGFKES